MSDVILPIIIALMFFVGYLFIALEAEVRLNKAAVALLTAAVCWAVYIAAGAHLERVGQLIEYLGEVSQVVFFVLGAMVIVELIDAHNGFSALTNRIQVRSKRALMWVLVLIAFFLSAILDNLTDTIVMVTLLRRLMPAGKERWLFGGLIVIAANAGGAWSPIGDVTTTMLWIGGRISTVGVIKELFFPSLVSAVAALAVASFFVRGTVQRHVVQETSAKTYYHSALILGLGIGCLVMVPVWKIVLGLPPFMGMLLGMAIMWLVTDLLHSKWEERGHLRVTEALRRIDNSVALFFLGILLAVTSLDAVGLLNQLAEWLNEVVGNLAVVAWLLGVLSAIVDNVPLTAAAAHMFELTQYPMDHQLWMMIAYAVGTGGSMLLIGSAAGVALMGIEKVNFWWYLRHISWLALIGYVAGFAWYLGQQWFTS
jgi:Na+/H+ antiporter NhaD/arsenite permease-like protein